MTRFLNILIKNKHICFIVKLVVNKNFGVILDYKRDKIIEIQNNFT